MSYTYDRGGQVTGASGVKFSDRYVYIKDIHYDEFGQRVYIKYGNDTESNYTYDPKRRWLSHIDTGNAYGTKFQNTSYDFDKSGNVLGYYNAALNVRQAYQYDDLYQLTRAEGTSPVQNNSQTSQYV